MDKYYIFYEDDEKTGIRQFDDEFKMWVECYIPKNKNDYTELTETMKKMIFDTM